MAVEVFNWILILVAFLVAPAGRGAAAPEIDVLGPGGLRFTIAVAARDGDDVTLVRVEPDGARRAFGTMKPADRQHPGAALAVTGPGGDVTINLAPFDAVAPRLAQLTAKRSPVQFEIDSHAIVVARRGEVVYASDRATGETFVIRLAPAASAPPAAPAGEGPR